MPENDISSLPIHLATRLVLDNVSYSNPLPDWFETLTIDYSARQETIKRKIQQYLDGVQPTRPFEVMVPKKNGQMQRWVVPSVNDQIILQACVSSMAETIDKKCNDPIRVFSYRYNRNPNRLALAEDSISSWRAFQEEARSRCSSDQCVLQIDLQEAFRSVDRLRFIEFLKKLVPNELAIRLLQSLLDVFADPEPGLPFVNDSVFFLGNAYFSEIDNIIARYTTNFIRYVDDYRIFGDSREQLESLLHNVSQDMRGLGFQINTRKVKLGNGEEYLDAVSKLKYAADEEEADYVDVTFGDVIQAKDMIKQIERILEKPDEYLNQGFGRFELGALRRMRVDALIAEVRGSLSSTRAVFSELLSTNTTIVRRIIELLRAYSQDESELWRTVWLLYLIQDIDYSNYYTLDIKEDVKYLLRGLEEDLKESLRNLQASNFVHPMIKLWANAYVYYSERKWDSVEMLHELDYIERGILCYGGQRNA